MTGLHACYRRQTQNTWWTIAPFSESSTNQACRFVSCTNTSTEASLQPQGFRVHTNHQIIRWACFSCKHLCQYCSLHRAGCHLLLEICCLGTVFELARGVTHCSYICRWRDFSISAYNLNSTYKVKSSRLRNRDFMEILNGAWSLTLKSWLYSSADKCASRAKPSLCFKDINVSI